jgi:hypothetical protein
VVDTDGGRTTSKRPIQERIFVYVAEGELKTDHSFYLAGQRFLTLRYEIERLGVPTHTAMASRDKHHSRGRC